MAKEVVEKTTVKTVTKRHPSKRKSSHKTSSPRATRIDRTLVENFVALQKVFTNLAVKFDSMSERIDKLLDVFEISAKSLAEKDFKEFVKINDTEILGKLDDLLEQNKVIAKGLIMIHEKTSPQRIAAISSPPAEMPNLPQYPMLRRQETPESASSINLREYQKSIAPPKEA